MSGNMTDDAVSEYLRDIELRLAGLPVLQRRELLADLRAHIATERLERGVNSEGEVLEILERLGSPEEVAAAAYEEAGPRTMIRPAPIGPPNRSRLLITAGIVAAIIFALLVGVAVLGSAEVGVTVPAVTPAP